MRHSHTLGDLIAALSLGVSGVALIAFALSFAGANLAYFDPRRWDESDRMVPLLIAVGPVLVAVREAARDAAALLILLTTSPKGAMT